MRYIKKFENQTSSNHKLRKMVNFYEKISDEELDEFGNKVPIDRYMNDSEYEGSGNFFLTKDPDKLRLAISKMCCNIKTEIVKLSNGQTLYFAFDYGHNRHRSRSSG